MRLSVYVLSCVMAAAAYGLTGGQALYSWDSVNFALGVDHIDVAAHRPHPPGYIALIAGARLLQFGSDVPTALLRVTVVAAAVSCILLWELIHGATRSRSAAWVGWSVAASSPLVWFYASTAEIYGLELLSSLMCATAAIACLRQPASPWPPVALGLSLGVSMLVKPTVAVLMTPLWVYVAAMSSTEARRRIVGAGLAGLAAGAVALATVVPFQQLVSLSQSQLAGTLGGEARFNPLHLINRRLRDVVYALCAAVGIGGIAALAFRRRTRDSGVATGALLLWAGPYLLMCVGLHFPKPGYALPLVAPLALWLASGYVGRSAAMTASVSMAICALNLTQFSLRPWPESATGGSKRYAAKTVAEKTLTEVNSILRPTVASIRQVDGAVEQLLASVPPSCNVQSAALLVEAGGVVTWRHAMYYLREPAVLQIDPDGGWMSEARRGEVMVPTDEPQRRDVDCLGLLSRTGWMLAGDGVTTRTLSGQVVYWGIGPTTVTWSRQGGVTTQGHTQMVRRPIEPPGSSRSARSRSGDQRR